MPKVVIKGLPSYVEEELPLELQRMEFPGAKTTKIQIKSKNAGGTASANPMFLVQLQAGTDIVKFRKIKYLCHCVISIEKYKPKKTLGTQCFRCQSFGHSSSNCNMPPRCVKCTETHPTADCPKKDRTEPAQCCNCQKDHPANYSKCTTRVEYLQKIQQKKQPLKTFNFTKPGPQTQNQVPHISTNVKMRDMEIPVPKFSWFQKPFMNLSTTTNIALQKETQTAFSDKASSTNDENDEDGPDDETTKEMLHIDGEVLTTPNLHFFRKRLMNAVR
ncbi:hypothetical protein O0L34_g12983 [Tuta absoluta]|nr:hypothetical protein O0L34_g12983 [Tuta absoluta]